MYTKPYGLLPSLFAIGGSPSKKHLHFLLHIHWFRVKEAKILLSVNWPACPVCRLLKLQADCTFKRLILATPLNCCLLRNMSVIRAPDNLKDQDYKNKRSQHNHPLGTHSSSTSLGCLHLRRSSSS